MTIRFGSLCSGVEAAHVAFQPLGWQPAWVAEIEPFPCAVLHHRCGAGRPERYPADGEGEKTWATNWKAICKNIPAEGNHLRNLGDMTTLPGRILAGEVEAPDVLVGGPPCFTAGHMVLTDRGYRPIEALVAGDVVMTHLGRMMPVLRTGSKPSPVGILKMVGNTNGIVCTPEHPFLADGGEWVDAKDMPARQWCALMAEETIRLESPSDRWTAEEAAWLAGWYLGDGWVRRHTGKRKMEVMLGISRKKWEILHARLGDRVSCANTGTCLRVNICDTRLAMWLVSEFGEGAHGKRIPAWWLNCVQGEELLDGYWCADGCRRGGVVTSNSVSRSLALGIRDLAQQHGWVSSFSLVRTAPTTTIQGRVVSQSDYWQVRAFSAETSRKSRIRDGYLQRRVQSFEMLGEQVVYNIEVEGDNSYILDGAIVHNCQAFSFAGKRKGLEDARGNLTLTYIEVLDAIDAVRVAGGKSPACAIYENVPGLLSDKSNAFGCLVAGLAGLDEPLETEDGSRWPNAGEIVGPRRAVAWCILDAQYFGVAQRRKRVWLVATPVAEPAASLGHLADLVRSGAGTILALGDCEKRSTPTRGKAGEDPAAPSGPGAAAGVSGPHAVAYREGAVSVDTYNGAISDTHQTLSSAATDINHVGGVIYPKQPMLYIGIDGDVPADQSVSETISTREGGITDTSHAVMQPCAYDGGQVCPTLTKMNANGAQRMPDKANFNHVIIPAEPRYIIRRLVCEETEILQGFPTGWTKIPWNGSPADQCPDGGRYKTMGNSWAVPCARWVGERLTLWLEGRLEDTDE